MTERNDNPYELLGMIIRELKLTPLTDEQIQQIYECESEHFEVPVPNFSIQPRREDSTQAAYIDGIPALIEFFGRPTIDVVYHELVHHALYFHCERVIRPPQDLIIEEATAEESDLKCPKCESDEEILGK